MNNERQLAAPSYAESMESKLEVTMNTSISCLSCQKCLHTDISTTNNWNNACGDDDNKLS